MSLLHMSFFGAVLIVVVAAIRVVTVNKLPKKTFLILWGIVLFRLLIPYSAPSTLSVYSLVSPKPTVNTLEGTPVDTVIPMIEGKSYEFTGTLSQQQPVNHTSPVIVIAKQLWYIIWLAGMILCITFFTISYLRCRFEFQTSVPVQNDFVEQWLKTHSLRRLISIRQSDKISTPLTYGVFKPVILMPKKTDWENTEQLQYVLLHEYMHICRYDAVAKLVATLALCIHWFNPFVWVMYFLFQRDIELACDESVVHRFGEASKSTYARMLINMEASKSGLMPLCSSFSKNAIEERITAIMKIKRTSGFAICVAVILIISITTAFATSATERKEDKTNIPNTNFSDEEFDKLLALQFDDYETMSVLEYRNKVWEIIDTKEYLDLLDRFLNDAALDKMKDSDETASFLFYILEPLTAEKWKSRAFDGYCTTKYQNAADNATLEFGVTLIIQNADTLTVREYNDARIGIMQGMQHILQDKTKKQLQNEAAMQNIVSTEVGKLKKQWGSDKLRIDVSYYYMPLSKPDEKDNGAQAVQQEQEKRAYPNGTEEDYRSLLALKTPDYQSMSVADFNMALLEWANDNYERMERISLDIGYNDFSVALESDELSFVTLSVMLSGMENGEYVKSSYTGRGEADPIYAQYLPEKIAQQSGHSAWCDLYYQFSYHIKDKKTLTVEERDRCISSMITGVQEFWSGADIEDVLKMSKEDIVKELNKIATKHSSSDITITISKAQVSFECMDERSLDAERQKEHETDKVGVVNTDTLKVREEASNDAYVVGLLPKSQELRILSEEGGFYHISILTEEGVFEGYVRKEYVDID